MAHTLTAFGNDYHVSEDYSGYTPMPLKEKYRDHLPVKFQGKKRKASNEGRTGLTHRRTLRTIVPGCTNCRKRR